MSDKVLFIQRNAFKEEAFGALFSKENFLELPGIMDITERITENSVRGIKLQTPPCFFILDNEILYNSELSDGRLHIYTDEKDIQKFIDPNLSGVHASEEICEYIKANKVDNVLCLSGLNDSDERQELCINENILRQTLSAIEKEDKKEIVQPPKSRGPH